jgi:DNA-binding transcriptional MocR family regulator
MQHTWQPGERMPSVRQLARQHGISLGTAFQVYYYLENSGVLEARPRSGYFVRARSLPRMPLPRPSASAATGAAVHISQPLATVLDTHANPAPGLLPSAAMMSLALLPTARLDKASRHVLRAGAGVGMSYEHPAGNELLRRQIAQRSPHWGGSLRAEDVVITSGCLEAVNLCLRAVTKPGDTVAVESPTYYGLLQSLENLGVKALEIATHPQTGVDLSELEAALDRQLVAACLLVPTFNNPLGSCMPEVHKQQLVRLLSHREIPLVEDDIYGELYFGATRPKACKAFDQDGWVLLCSSFSKQLAPGYRVGWAALPARYRARVEQLKFMHNLATATLPQLVISHYLAHGRHDQYLRGLRTALAAQVRHTAAAVEAYFPAGTRLTQPGGGFVLWAELPEPRDLFALHQQAHQQGVGFAPGPLFSAQQRYANCLRLTCGHPWSSESERAVAKLGGLLK